MSTIFPIIMYHGTNEKILDLPKNEIFVISDAYYTVLKYYYNTLSRLGIDGVYALTNIYGSDLFTGYKAVHSSLNNIATKWPLNKHVLMLTNNYKKAEGYARRSYYCGEISYFTELLGRVIKEVQIPTIEMTTEDKTAFNLISNFESQKEPNGVVLTYKIYREDIAYIGDEAQKKDWDNNLLLLHELSIGCSDSFRHNSYIKKDIIIKQ